MKYFSLTDKPTYLTDKQYVPMAQAYWGAEPMPEGAEIIGGYSDKKRAGALIRLASGIYVCGNAGRISNIPQVALTDSDYIV